MRHLTNRSLLAALALGTLVLALAACGGGNDSASAEEADPVSTEVESPDATVEAETTDVTETTEDVEDDAETAAETETDAASESGSGDAGPAAAPGKGTLNVNGTVYAFTVTECSFTDEGPTASTFEVRGTTSKGEPFEMTQFFLNGDWSQSSVQLDRAGPTEIYVIRSAASEGAEPAAVNGKNITWAETYFELDPAANKQTSIGEGIVNLTCT